MNDIRTTPSGGMEAIGFGGSWETVPKAAQQEIERLRNDNASLWERVKRWEPMADKSQFGSGGISSAQSS